MMTPDANFFDLSKLPRTQLSITMKPLLIQQLKAEAANQNRTVSNLVEHIIEQHLARQKPA